MLPIVAIAWLLAGCTDDTTGHQFATDPRPTQEPTAPVVVTQPAPAPTAPAPPPRPLAELVTPRGAPDRIFFRAGPELWTVTATGDDPTRVFGPGPGEAVLDFSASPSRDRVALLVERSRGDREVRIVAPDGRTIEVVDPIPVPRVDQPTRGTPGPNAGTGATPVAESDMATPSSSSPPAGTDPVPTSLDWSPQGDQLLLGFEPGGLVAISVVDPPGERTVASVAKAVGPGNAAWSPTGEQVAFASPLEATQGWALVVSSAVDEKEPLSALQGGAPGRSVFDFAWLPDGRAILYTEGDPTADHVANTDLWRVAADGGDRTLVASAGSAAPVADIDHFVPSPDGRAVAYTVVVPGERESVFHSLWVRDLIAGQGVRIDVPPENEVTDIWWTSEGLIYRTMAAGERDAADSAEFALYRVGRDGVPQLILRAALDPATPAATPVVA